MKFQRSSGTVRVCLESSNIKTTNYESSGAKSGIWSKLIEWSGNLIIIWKAL